MNKETGLLGLNQEDRYTSYTHEKTKTLSKKNGNSNTQPLTSQTAPPKLNRPEQVILFRLRTGHNKLNGRMYSKFKVGESEMCPRQTSWLQNIYCSTANYMMLWGGTRGQSRYHWGTSSMATWRSWGGQPLLWGRQTSPSSELRRR